MSKLVVGSIKNDNGEIYYPSLSNIEAREIGRMIAPYYSRRGQTKLDRFRYTIEEVCESLSVAKTFAQNESVQQYYCELIWLLQRTAAISVKVIPTDFVHKWEIRTKRHQEHHEVAYEIWIGFWLEHNSI